MVHIRKTALTVSDTDNNINQPQSEKHQAFIILTNLIYGCLRSIISFLPTESSLSAALDWANHKEEFEGGEVVKVNNKVIPDMIINVPYSQLCS